MEDICEACEGTGNNFIDYDGPYDIDYIIEDCPLCGGSGRIDLEDYFKFIEEQRKGNI